MLSNKAGVTHLHVGERDERLAPVVEAMDRFGLEPRAVYPTHVSRSAELLKEAAALTRRGSFVDMDTTEPDLSRQLDGFAEAGGDLQRLTLSTDAGSSSPRNLCDQLSSALSSRWPLHRLLPLVTTNTAAVLALHGKGRLAVGCDGDVVVLHGRSLQRRHVVVGGRVLLRDGQLAQSPAFLEDSNRHVVLHGHAQ
jgi:beta-aspartyl-dipeptidase (metallo-type)